MNVEIGRNITQTEGFAAFILNLFPQRGLFDIPHNILLKNAEADRLVGKLDGITQTLPDVDFFLKMFIAKDAASSAQIEGTKSTIIDAIESDAGISSRKTDVEDIIYYIKALNYGIKRMAKFPLSLRLIREIHANITSGARATQFSNPGEFRKGQNWVGGTNPGNASFVPPPVDEMHRALGDLENYLHYENRLVPLVHIGIMHGQFETIHPFLDGNGRTGRLLITLLMYHRKLLERPVLFLSSYFKRHQKTYYQKLDDYHNGSIERWIDFFLDAVIETSHASIKISRKIRQLRDDDIGKIIALAKRESESGLLVLSNLFGTPIVNTRKIMEWTGFTRAGAQKVIDRFIAVKILEARPQKSAYDRTYVYQRYLKMFLSD